MKCATVVHVNEYPNSNIDRGVSSVANCGNSLLAGSKPCSTWYRLSVCFAWVGSPLLHGVYVMMNKHSLSKESIMRRVGYFGVKKKQVKTLNLLYS